MSIETWKEEFYPIPANAEMSDMEALLHAKRKWEGLQKENLLKHHLHAQNGILFAIDTPLERFVVGAESCSLCLKYVLREKAICWLCPLNLSRGASCDCLSYEEEQAGKDNKNIDAPWYMFTRFGNPEPMLEALEDTIKFVTRNKINE